MDNLLKTISPKTSYLTIEHIPLFKSKQREDIEAQENK
jgi:hypothetical protein